MSDVVMNQEEVMELVANIFSGASDIESARNGIINLMNNPSYNIPNNLKNILLHVASSKENIIKFKEEMEASVEEKHDPVIIPETSDNVFFDKIMAKGITRTKLLDNRIIVPYAKNNEQFIYALMEKSLVNNLSFILVNDFDIESNKSNTNFVVSTIDKNITRESFYEKLSSIADTIDSNYDYLQNLNQELTTIVSLFNSAINSQVSFNIGLTPRQDNREVIITLSDEVLINKLKQSGVVVNDNKIKMNNQVTETLSKIENEITKEVTSSITSSPIEYSLYDSKKADGTTITTSLYKEKDGPRVYMSTNISNSDAQVNLEKNYLFTSKEIFYNNLIQFFNEKELVKKGGATVTENSNMPLSYTFNHDDGTHKIWENNTEVDSYGEVINLYFNLETLPNAKEVNQDNMSMGGNSQVLVKSNKSLPPILPSQETDKKVINNSGFSSTFLFVTLVTLEMIAIGFGIFLLAK